MTDAQIMEKYVELAETAEQLGEIIEERHRIGIAYMNDQVRMAHSYERALTICKAFVQNYEKVITDACSKDPE